MDRALKEKDDESRLLLEEMKAELIADMKKVEADKAKLQMDMYDLRRQRAEEITVSCFQRLRSIENCFLNNCFHYWAFHRARAINENNPLPRHKRSRMGFRASVARSANSRSMSTNSRLILTHSKSLSCRWTPIAVDLGSFFDLFLQGSIWRVVRYTLRFQHTASLVFWHCVPELPFFLIHDSTPDLIRKIRYVGVTETSGLWSFFPLRVYYSKIRKDSW